jgi:uncharacterized membrane-anchored protein YitT (DUF2179 family)
MRVMPTPSADITTPTDHADGGSVQRHTLLEDAMALLTGTLFVALGLMLFRHAGLLTGGTAGIALLVHYVGGLPFGVAFFVLNLPFYLLAWRRMGRRFTLKTLVCVSLLAVLAETLPALVDIARVEPAFAAVGGGLVMGAGFLILFRHRASLGGLNVMVLWLQDRYGWSAGKVQAAVDAAIVLAALPWVTTQQVLLSVVGALALNLALAMNHKPGRYTAF